MFLVNLVSDTRSLQLFSKTVPPQELAENPAQELFLYSSCLRSLLDKVETVITFCLKHTLGITSMDSDFQALAEDSRVWGSAGVTCLQQHFTCFTEHSEHALLQQHLDPEHFSEADPDANGKYCWKLKNPSFPKKFPYLHFTIHRMRKALVLLLKSPNFFSPQIAPSPHLPQSRVICPSSQTSQTS